jgi:hypothetical protein
LRVQREDHQQNTMHLAINGSATTEAIRVRFPSQKVENALAALLTLENLKYSALTKAESILEGKAINHQKESITHSQVCLGST